MKYSSLNLALRVLSLATPAFIFAQDGGTVALWLFDEQQGLYPSHVITDQSENDYPMVIGPGGQIVKGKFGNALEAIQQPPLDTLKGEERLGMVDEFGLHPMPPTEGRTVEPMTWFNANFCALMTSGENHLRKEVGFPRTTETRLNLGPFDWTVEFWYLPTRRYEAGGVVFEVGQGPRGEPGSPVTRLVLNADAAGFTLINEPGQVELSIPSDSEALNPDRGEWHHLAFVYDAGKRQLAHYVDGKAQKRPARAALRALDAGEEDYFSVGRNGAWGNPLPGRLDELRFSTGQVYTKAFTPPGSFAPVAPEVELLAGPPLLFDETRDNRKPLDLGGRKHVFIDDAIVQEMDNVAFTVNPPRLAERVIDNIEGPFRKHLTVVEDEDGLIRIFNSIHDDYLAVRTSRDGINFEVPDTGAEYRGQKNIVIHQMVGGLGNPFIDPNGPPEHRWKYITGYHRRGIYLYTSPDGWNWTRWKTAVLPFRSGTQSCTFYDDQRQLYVGYHRTGINHTPAGDTQRESSLTETKDLYSTWKYKPVTMEDYEEAEKTRRLRDPKPWYLDNGPLTPGGFGLEFPFKFGYEAGFDPVGTDFYITKATKYEWAPDTYVAFPIAYFHYENDGPVTRRILGEPERERGSGPIETHVSVSRNGVDWHRYARPAYVGIGKHLGRNIYQAYTAHGMVRRGDELWQYYYGESIYHSTYRKGPKKSAVYRLVQRLDGFVSADTPYDEYGYLATRPLVFEGDALELNIDTDAAGYAQVGFLDENGEPIEGYTVDDCIYINGDFIRAKVEWLDKGADLSALEGRTVQLLFRMRGSKLYAMQFVHADAAGSDLALQAD